MYVLNTNEMFTLKMDNFMGCVFQLHKLSGEKKTKYFCKFTLRSVNLNTEIKILTIIKQNDCPKGKTWILRALSSFSEGLSCSGSQPHVRTCVCSSLCGALPSHPAQAGQVGSSSSHGTRGGWRTARPCPKPCWHPSIMAGSGHHLSMKL